MRHVSDKCRALTRLNQKHMQVNRFRLFRSRGIRTIRVQDAWCVHVCFKTTINFIPSIPDELLSVTYVLSGMYSCSCFSKLDLCTTWKDISFKARTRWTGFRTHHNNIHWAKRRGVFMCIILPVTLSKKVDELEDFCVCMCLCVFIQWKWKQKSEKLRNTVTLRQAGSF